MWACSRRVRALADPGPNRGASGVDPPDAKGLPDACGLSWQQASLSKGSGPLCVPGHLAFIRN